MDMPTTSHTSESYPTTFPLPTPLPQGNGGGSIPNTAMYMGQMPWSQSAYGPQAGNDASQFNHPYVFPHNGGLAAPLWYPPVPSLSGVGAVDAHNSFHSTQPFSVVNIAHATYNQAFLNPHHSHPGGAFPPQHSSTPPDLYSQSSIPLAAFPAFTTQQMYDSYSQNTTLPTPQSTYLPQPYGVTSATNPTPSLLPQITASSGSRKRVGESGEDLQRDKRVKLYCKIFDDKDFQPLEETDERGNQRFKCLRDGCGTVIISTSYYKHIQTASHRGAKKGTYTCVQCGKVLSRIDSLKRHSKRTCARQRLKLGWGEQPSESDTSALSSESASPIDVPAALFTFPESATAPLMSSASPTSNVENVQIAPSADEILQSEETATFAYPLPAVPTSLELPGTAFDSSANVGLFATFANLHPEVSALFDNWANNLSSSDPLPNPI